MGKDGFASSSEILQKATEVENFNKSQLGCPSERPHRNRTETIQEWNGRLAEQNRWKTVETVNGKKTYVSGDKHCCKKPLEELEPITLREMKTPHVHLGKYLLCRSVTRSATFVGVAFVVEDVRGDVEHLSLFNVYLDPYGDPDGTFPEGTVLILKEPCLKFLRASSTGGAALRCDSPSDVVVLQPTDDLLGRLAPQWAVREPLTFEALKKRGNDSYRSKRYEESIRYYDRANRIDPESGVICLNRAAAYLQLGRHSAAYAEAQRARRSKLSQIEEVKTIFRLGKAAYGMRNWHLALEHFSNLLDHFPDNAYAPEEMAKCKARIRESETGKYDLKFLYHEHYRRGIHYFDAAEFVGPVQIVDIPGKGKGLIATTDINEGTLLIASKAFSSTVDDPKLPLSSANLIANRIDSQSGVTNVAKTIQTLANNPDRAEELYSLFAGDSDREEVVPYGVVDVGRIEKICTFNSYYVSADRYIGRHKIQSSTGLWILPSFLNHSCLPNAFREVYGDLLMVYALRDIRTTEEITVAYEETSRPLSRRAETVARDFQFECRCPLCETDRSDPDYGRRARLCEELADVGRLNRTNPKAVHLRNGRLLVEKIRNSFERRFELKFQLVLALELLSVMYFDLGDIKKCDDCFEEMNRVLGEYKFVKFPHWCSLFCHGLMRAFQMNEREGRQYLEEYIDEYKPQSGEEGYRYFKIIYSDPLDEFNF